MATDLTTSVLQSDIEKGQVDPGSTRMTNYVRDITWRVIPLCVGFLIILSAGATLVITLMYNKALPHKETTVVSIMLIAFIILFCIGRAFIYHRKHYPPLTKGPNAPDRPPPKNKTWKDRASVIGTLTIGKFKLGKIYHLHHHEIEPETNPQGIPDKPTELSGSPHGQDAPKQPNNVRSSNTTKSQDPTGYGMRDKNEFLQLNKKPVRRIPIPGHNHHNPRHHSYTPSEDKIPEVPEEDEQDDTENDMRTPVSRHSNTRNKRTAVNADGVSPMSRNSGKSYSPYSPNVQMTGANRNLVTRNESPKSPQSFHMPETKRTSREYPIEALQPPPRSVHLNVDKSEPLANLVRIPHSINDRAFTEALPDNYLYIIDNQPSGPDDGSQVAQSGCRCECKYNGVKRPISQVSEPKTDGKAIHVDAPRISSIETTAPKVSKVREYRNTGDSSEEENIFQTTHPSSTTRRRRAESRRHETDLKRHTTSHQEKDNPSKPSNSHMEFPNQPPSPKLPSAPPKTKPPPSRRDPESPRIQADRRRHQYYTAHNYFRSGKEAHRRPLNRTWGRQQIPKRRGHRANTITEGYTNKQQSPLKFVEKEALDIRPGTGLRNPERDSRQTLWVPPRGSSRGFSDIYGTASRTASDGDNSSESSDYRQFE
ncbi:uncharacterized protein GGS22DRAFT_194895 [Annulohypoxylon maeteangense]|uniref:uncharacterized protein n=1 Tax=Annulohypoxylon maeteangense TaxID=1927788 RepID=UPI002008CB65|nr:uncharacterized protein GGS22DRAFT_194895 [Annulohypoxylon maeteangense]KAI0884409.1 hypothetical protein GGS22DRAFT_194895 [Annulohypoxylon maeteangense]